LQTSSGVSVADLPLDAEVALLADQHTGHLLNSREIQDLVVDRLHHLERLAGVDRVDQEVAVDTDCVFRREEGVLVLGSMRAYSRKTGRAQAGLRVKARTGIRRARQVGLVKEPIMIKRGFK
jgi:hypothetical protein